MPVTTGNPKKRRAKARPHEEGLDEGASG